MAYVPPTADQAIAVASLMFAGIPAIEACGIVAPEIDPVVLPDVARRWEKDPAVRTAVVTLKGTWLSLSTEERAKVGVEKTYNAMAYFLFCHNYGELETAKRSKADACLKALEAKLAGMAGKGDLLTQFWAEAVAKSKPERVQ